MNRHDRSGLTDAEVVQLARDIVANGNPTNCTFPHDVASHLLELLDRPRLDRNEAEIDALTELRAVVHWPTGEPITVTSPVSGFVANALAQRPELEQRALTAIAYQWNTMRRQMGEQMLQRIGWPDPRRQTGTRG